MEHFNIVPVQDLIPSLDVFLFTFPKFSINLLAFRFIQHFPNPFPWFNLTVEENDPHSGLSLLPSKQWESRGELENRKYRYIEKRRELKGNSPRWRVAWQQLSTFCVSSLSSDCSKDASRDSARKSWSVWSARKTRRIRRKVQEGNDRGWMEECVKEEWEQRGISMLAQS